MNSHLSFDSSSSRSLSTSSQSSRSKSKSPKKSNPNMSPIVPNQTKNIFLMLKEQELGKKYKSYYDLLPEINKHKMIFYKVSNMQDFCIQDLIRFANNNNVTLLKIFAENPEEINKYLIFKQFNITDYSYDRYMGQHLTYCETTRDYEVISCDILGTKNMNKNEEIICNDIQFKDNVFINESKTQLYYIDNKDKFKERIDKIYKEKDANFEVKFENDHSLSLSSKKRNFSTRSRSQSPLDRLKKQKDGGGKKPIKYIKYGKYTRSVHKNANKLKYIIINKQIIYLQNIKGKYNYVNKK